MLNTLYLCMQTLTVPAHDYYSVTFYCYFIFHLSVLVYVFRFSVLHKSQ